MQQEDWQGVIDLEHRFLHVLRVRRTRVTRVSLRACFDREADRELLWSHIVDSMSCACLAYRCIVCRLSSSEYLQCWTGDSSQALRLKVMACPHDNPSCQCARLSRWSKLFHDDLRARAPLRRRLMGFCFSINALSCFTRQHCLDHCWNNV